ncbi:MAG: hypothetical protein MAG794_00043 [Gammaproteobacteria bacterium]|nr:hypothetical protein [Gammaproteobacteria bacterium]
MAAYKHAVLYLAFCLMGAALAPLVVTAQDQGTSSAAKLVTDYLQRDIFLQPGVGLKKVKIGTAFDRVLQTWGPPTQKKRDNIFGNRWTYKIADHTMITLIGGDSVEVMNITGKFTSPYVTTEGASFGMAQHQLATIYGPKETDSERLNYNDRGIGFVLDHGQVSKIRLFPPK